MAATSSDFSATSLRLHRPLHCRSFKPSSPLIPNYISVVISSSSKPSSLHCTSRIRTEVQRNEEKETPSSNESNESSRLYRELSGLIASGSYTESVTLVKWMSAKGYPPDKDLCFVLLKGLAEVPDPDSVALVVELLEAEGRQDKHAYNILIGCLCRTGQVISAFEALGRMRSHGFFPKINPCNSIVEMLCDNRMLNAALATVQHFRQEYRCTPNYLTYVYLIECAMVTRGVEEVRTLLDQMALDRLQLDNQKMEEMISRIINKLCRRREVDEALVFIKNLPLEGSGPHVTSYINLLELLLTLGKEQDADSLIDEMLRRLQSLHRSKLIRIVEMLCAHGLLGRAREMIDVAVRKFGLDVDMVCCSVLISAYLEDERMDSVIELVDFMTSNQQFPNVVIFNTIMSGLCQNGHTKEAIEVLENMRYFGVHPDGASYNSIVRVLWSKGERKMAVKMLERMVEEDGLTLNVIFYNLIMTCLSKDGMIDDCLLVLRMMDDNGIAADTISYNIVLHSLCKARRMEEAMGLFEEMLMKGYKPNLQTYNTILKGIIVAGCKAEAVDFLNKLDERKILSKSDVAILKENLQI